METNYTWKTRFFSHNYEILQSDNQVGEIRNKAFTRTTEGELNGRRFLFEMKGFFRQQTKIIDLKDNSVMFDVNIGSWRSKASFNYNGKDYTWQYDNFWNTKFSINSENGPVIKYQTYNFGGDIVSYINDEVLILTGLLIKNYFRQRAATAAAAS